MHLAEVEQNANIIFGLRHYTGTDLQTPIDGDYMYSIEIKMNDPLIPWMEGKIKILETLLYGAEDNEEDGGFSGYADMVSSDPKYYNSYTDRFTQEGIEKIEHPDSPYKTVNDYSYASSKIVSFFTVLDNFLFFRDELPALYHFLYAISSPAFGNPSGVNQVLKVMENIYSKVLNVFSSASGYKKAVDSQHVGADQQLAAGREPKRDFVISHLFPQVIKGEINHSTGYDYISIEDTIKEDTLPSKGLKRLSRTQLETRANMEETKFFTNVLSDYDIVIPEFPLAFDPNNWMQEYGGAVDPEDYNVLFNEAKQKEGILLNAGDTVLNNKYAFFSPSLVNFAGEEPINLLNGGSLNSDMRDTNNAMLNAIRYNLTKQNDYDYPDPGSEVATGRIKTLPLGLNLLAGNTTPEVVVTDDVSDLKYDLLNILNQRQTTVRIPKAPAGPAGPTKGKSKGVANVFGGPDGAVSSELIEASTIAIDPNAIGSQYDLGPAGGEGPNIFNSKINPSQLLLTITQQNAFDFLDDKTWKWKHYVMDFGYSSFKSEYQKFMGSGGNADGTGYSNKPLKVAPNQVKCLMSNLDYTKPFSVGVFNELILKIYDTKPGVYSNLTEGDTKQFYVSTNMYGEEKVISEPNRKVIYETPEFLSFFLMNFKNLVELQALVAYEDTYETSISPIAGFDVDKELGYNVNAPIWKKMDYEMYEKLLKDVQTIPGGGQRNILVRLVPYEKDLYGVKRYPIMELPIYNMHFIIDLSEYNVGAVYFPDPVVIEELDPDEAGATEYEGFIPVGVGTTLFGESVTTGMMPEMILETDEGWVGGFAGGVDVGTGAGVVGGEPGTSPVVQAGQGGLVGIAGAGAGQEGPKLGPLGDPDADGGGVPLMQKGIFSFLKTSSQLAGRLGVTSETISTAAAPAAPVEQQGMKEADQAAMKATTEQSQY